ncbi:MAG: phage holin family protein [Prevotellaceae bacterium]|nr:phage holin family protein [Prevotellaceae bacterium]
MLSSEKNIEQVALLIERLKRYLELKGEYFKFDAVEKIIKLLTAFASAAILLVLFFTFLFYLAFAVASWLAPSLGTAGGFCAVAGLYLLLFILVVIFRKAWIERPILRFITRLFLNN